MKLLVLLFLLLIPIFSVLVHNDNARECRLCQYRVHGRWGWQLKQPSHPFLGQQIAMIRWPAAGQEAKSDDFNGEDNHRLVIHWLGLPTRCFLQLNAAFDRSIFDSDSYMLQHKCGLCPSIVTDKLRCCPDILRPEIKA